MPSNLGTGSSTDPSQSIPEETAPDLDSAEFKGLHHGDFGDMREDLELRHEDCGDVYEALGDVLEDCYQGQVEIARWAFLKRDDGIDAVKVMEQNHEKNTSWEQILLPVMRLLPEHQEMALLIRIDSKFLNKPEKFGVPGIDWQMGCLIMRSWISTSNVGDNGLVLGFSMKPRCVRN